MKKIVLISVLSLFSISLFAQEVTFDKKNFKDNKKEFKEAEGHLKMADELMMPMPFPRYGQALNYYLKAQEFNRSEEHTSELQSRPHLVCRLLLEKKKKKKKNKYQKIKK